MAKKRPVQPMAALIFPLDRSASRPLHQQISEAIRARILNGQLSPGARLPSSRRLAEDLGVARATVVLALSGLAAEGYLVSRAGAATSVAADIPGELGQERPPPAAARRARLSATARVLSRLPTGAARLGPAPRAFRPGVPALDHFPLALWSRLSARCHARASMSLLEGGEAAGWAPLRRAIATHVSTTRGVACQPAQVFVTSGTMTAVDEMLRLLVPPDAPVWIEDPGYLGARRAVIAAGACPVPVPVDAAGLDVEAGIARAPHARAVVLAPSHQYPLGVTLALPRRFALLRWASRVRAVVLEDDYDSEFHHHGRPLLALAGLDRAGCVVYLGTFSKSMFPGLRLGYLVVPAGLVDAVAAARAASGPPAPSLTQATLAAFLDEGHFATHLRRMRVTYRERRERLVDALALECGDALQVAPSDTGMQLLAWLSERRSDRTIAARAAEFGVEVGALSNYLVARRAPPGLVLGYGGVAPGAMRAAARRLGQALRGGG